MSLIHHITTIFPKVLTTFIYLYGLHGLLFIVDTNKHIILILIKLLTIFSFFYGIYAYYKTSITGPGSPLDFPQLHHDPISNEQPPSTILNNSITLKQNGQFRYCSKCQVWKPDRSHHCSSCNRCQLKMDHHCPWFADCIGFNNYKFFIQFLINSVGFSFGISILTICQVYKFFQLKLFNDEFLSLALLILTIISTCLFVAVLVFTMIQIYFLLNNLTTLEYYEFNNFKSNLKVFNDSINDNSQHNFKNAFNLGYNKNLIVVMGLDWKEWLLPIKNQNQYDDAYYNNGLLFEYDTKNYELIQQNTVSNRLLQGFRGV